jgi:hypothetical protein
MNDRPEQYDWQQPVQETMSDQDFAMIVQEMRRDPGYEAGRLRRLAKLARSFAKLRNHPDFPAEGFKQIRDDDDGVA